MSVKTFMFIIADKIRFLFIIINKETALSNIKKVIIMPETQKGCLSLINR